MGVRCVWDCIMEHSPFPTPDTLSYHQLIARALSNVFFLLLLPCQQSHDRVQSSATFLLLLYCSYSVLTLLLVSTPATISRMIERSLVDVFVPFLPLERQHVRSCVRRELGRRVMAEHEQVGGGRKSRSRWVEKGEAGAGGWRHEEQEANQTLLR